jgi:hypothetical protein
LGSKYGDVAILETGEVLSFPVSFLNNPQEYSIRSKKQEVAFKKMLRRSEERFFWGNLNNITLLLAEKKVSSSALGMLLILCCNLQFDSDMLCTQKKRPLTNEELIKIAGVPERSFRKAMKELQTNGIITNEGTQKKPVYKINKQYHFIGVNKEAKHFLKVYKDGIRALQDSGLSLKEIGFIYAILPLVDTNRCVLVKDRSKGADADNLHSIESLCEYLGITRANLSKYLGMTFIYRFKDGQYKVPVFGKFSVGVGRVNSYLVNPVILRRAGTNIDCQRFSNLEEMFKIYKQAL